MPLIQGWDFQGRATLKARLQTKSSEECQSRWLEDVTFTNTKLESFPIFRKRPSDGVSSKDMSLLLRARLQLSRVDEINRGKWRCYIYEGRKIQKNIFIFRASPLSKDCLKALLCILSSYPR